MTFIFLGKEAKIKAPFISVLETEWENQFLQVQKVWNLCENTFFSYF